MISQRSADRPTFPLMWECVGGSALKGENSLSAALRETEEEVGVKFSDIVDVWLFEYDGPVNLETVTTKEVAQTLWMKRPEIKDLLNKGKLVNSLRYFFELENE